MATLDNHPTCGVVIQKEVGDQKEIVCSERAISLMSIVNQDNPAQVIAVVLTCEKHDLEMSNGKVLIFVAENGAHIAVQTPKQEQSNDATHDTPNAAPDGGSPQSYVQ